MDRGISIIIPTLNRTKLVSLVLSKLLKQISLHDEILVIVDPADSYQTFSRLRTQFKSSNLKIIQGTRKYNVSSLRNLGIRLSNNNYLALLDDDCVPTNSYVKNIRKILSKHESNIVFQGNFTNVVLKQNVFATTFTNSVDFHNYYFRNNIAFTSTPIQHLVVNNFFVNKSILNKYSIAFDENNYPTVGEQLDISYKFQQHGIKLIGTSKVRVKHVKYQFGLKRLIKRSFLEGYVEKKLDYQYGANKSVKKLFSENFKKNQVNKIFSHIRYSLHNRENIFVIALSTLGYLAYLFGFLNALIAEHIHRLLRDLRLVRLSPHRSK